MRLIKKSFRLVLLLIAVCSASTLLISLYVRAVTWNEAYSTIASVPKEQVALVLGASIHANGSLSSVLKERADAAVALYKAGKVSKILVSGDNSSVGHNEVFPTGTYLSSIGIPKSDIFLDYAGFDTYSSMYRAKYIFDVSSLTIVSQGFHLPRALFIAHTLGLPAIGLDASAPGERYVLNDLREIPATTKALFDLLVGRKPQYLGGKYPVSGDGSATWVGTSTSGILDP